MKSKIIFAVIFIAVLGAVAIAMIFFIKEWSPATLAPSSENPPATELRPTEEEQQLKGEPQKAIPASNAMDTDYFTVNLPQGWEKTSEGDDLPLIISDTLEEITDEKAKETGFRTNFSINSTSLGETSLDDYVELVKASLVQTIAIMEITKEEQAVINGAKASIVEVKSAQDNLNFRTILAIFAGKENTVWAFSFNTLEDSWPDNESIFRQIIESIKMKPR